MGSNLLAEAPKYAGRINRQSSALSTRVNRGAREATR